MVALEKGFYVGTFQHGLDVKNRLTIPAQWRFPGDEGESAYLALPNPNGSITVYPPKMVADIEQKLQGVSMLSDQKKLQALLGIFSLGARFGCDKQGRIGLPEKLRAHAGIGREAMLAGTIITFHIWEPGRFAKEMTAKDGTPAFDPAVLREYGL